MVKELFCLLENGGVRVRLPGKETGRCTAAYAVVSEGETHLGTTGKSLLTEFFVTVAVPAERYSELCAEEEKIKSALIGSPFKFTGSGIDEVDGELGAYTKTLTFSAHRRGRA